MADLGLLFTLMLVALAFVVIGTCFIVYIMIIGERQKRRQAETGLTPDKQLYEDCPHYIGYLNGYPADQPVPEECYGCANTMECMNRKAQAATASAKEPAKS